jgi:hypothetical protein
MTQQEFQECYAKITGFEWTRLEKYLEAVPCKCGKGTCPGWQMITLPNELPPLQVSSGQVSSSRRTHGRQFIEVRSPSLAHA